MIPESGGMYCYLHEAFGALPAFLYMWVTTVIRNSAGAAIVALTFANYLLQPLFPGCEAVSDAATRLIAALLICESFRRLACLVAVIFVGFYLLDSLSLFLSFACLVLRHDFFDSFLVFAYIIFNHFIFFLSFLYLLYDSQPVFRPILGFREEVSRLLWQITVHVQRKFVLSNSQYSPKCVGSRMPRLICRPPDQYLCRLY